MRRFFSYQEQELKSQEASPSRQADDTPSNRYGVHLISEGIEPTVDIVAIHGLNGDYEKTWTASNGKNWLRDLLSQDIKNARIFSWSYDARTHDKSRVSCQYLYDHAQTLVSELSLEREITQTSRRPIIFIAHSLGGIVLKSALIHSNNATEGHLSLHRSISLSTYGIFFMGTPHQGGDDRLLQHLEPNSEWLQTQSNQYIPLSTKFVTKFGFEEYETLTPLGKKLLVVPRHSAVIPGALDAEPIAIHADHVHMVRFESRQDKGYKAILNRTLLMLTKAGDVVKARWDMEEKHKAMPDEISSSESSYFIPFDENPNFVGREVDMKDLQHSFFDTALRKLSLSGLGGIGKTQLAIQFAYWTKHNRPSYSVFWLSASSVESFSATCAKLVLELKIPKLEEKEDAQEVIERFLNSKQSGKWLLIIDNAEDMEVLFGSPRIEGAHGISRFFPRSESGLTLFTTRTLEAAGSLSGNDVREIGELNLFEATRLFYKLRNIGFDEAGNDEKHQVELLAKRLDCLPLAITQAARYMAMTGISTSEYLRLLERTDKGTINLLSREFRDNSTQRRSAVATTWLVSFEQIRQHYPSAAELLYFISQIEPRAIPFSLLPDFATEEEKRNSIGILFMYTFLTRQQDENLFNMHRLVHLGIIVWIQNDCMSKEIAESTVQRLAEVFPYDDYENQSTWRAYLPHAMRITMNPCITELFNCFVLCVKVGMCLHADGRVYESVVWLERACDGLKDRAETDSWRLWAQYGLAMAYQSAGRIDEAIKTIEYVVAIKEKTLGETDSDRLASQHELAQAYETVGRVDDAVKILERIAAIEENTLTEEDPERLTTQHTLAVAYRSAGRINEALRILEHVVAIREKTFSEEHPDRLSSLHVLARTYRSAGRIDEALRILEHVVTVQEKTLSEEHPSRLGSQQSLAVAYRSAGQTDKAIKILEHVVTFRKTLSETHSDRLRSQQSLAIAYLSAGRIDEAVEMLEYVVTIRETLIETHPDRLASQHVLAIAYHSAGRIDEAVRLLEHVVTVRETLSETHPDRLTSQHELALTYESVQRYVEAVKLLEHVVAIEEKTLHETHPDRLISQEALAEVKELARQHYEGVNDQPSNVMAISYLCN